MAAAVAEPASTIGAIGMWNGTKDGADDGYIDYSNGSTNLRGPKQFEVEILDIRHLEYPPSYEKDGYGLIKHTPSITKEHFLAAETPEGKAFIQKVYFPEIEELVKSITGGKVVRTVSFRTRQQDLAPGSIGSKDMANKALPVAHFDRDPETAHSSLYEVFGDEAASLIAKYPRYAQVKVWRSISEPVQKWPLCFIDTTPVPNWSYETHTGRVFSRNDPRISLRGKKDHDTVVKHDPRYKYRYVSNVGPDEAFVFSAFDSDITRSTPHGAFWDKNSLPDAPPRRSIEIASWVFFE
ncbi:putative TauD/TfdA-like domain-containing protein [Seiridium cardinale]|uniref:TauD/TfdA-like domain-containing protein n=1 Tax=Seiridium cardinale TaxID=138064 RepID=A0ABR2XY78_9PEZI